MNVFLALLRRDLVVTARHAGPLLVSTLTQPILVILVFGNIMPRLGLVAAGFGAVMAPGQAAAQRGRARVREPKPKTSPNCRRGHATTPARCTGIAQWVSPRRITTACLRQ